MADRQEREDWGRPEQDENQEYIQFRAGSFVYTAEDNLVIITKDTSDGIITIRDMEFDNFEQAEDAAWKLSELQKKENALLASEQRHREVGTIWKATDGRGWKVQFYGHQKCYASRYVAHRGAELAKSIHARMSNQKGR